MPPKKKPDDRKDFSEPRRGPARGVSGKSRMGGSRSGSDLSPLQQANQLMGKLENCQSEEEEVALARKALRLSPDCFAALVVLAHNMASAADALVLYDQALTIGRRLIGEQVLADHAGSLWEVPDAQPLLKASLGRAQCLSSLDRMDEASQEIRELLRLDPEDHLLARYMLAVCLLGSQRHQELTELFARFPDDHSTFWLFSKTLLAYRQEGDCQRSRDLLQQARKANPHVLDYLLDDEIAEGDIPAYYAPGETSEAAVYFADFRPGWRETPGAIPWLRAQSAEQPQQIGIGPTPQVLVALRKLPQPFGTKWQAVVQRLALWVRVGAQHIRPWAVLVVDADQGLIIAQEVLTTPPTSAVLFDVLAAGMQKPLIGNPERPAEVHIYDQPEWECLCSSLEEIGVDCIFQKELPEIEAAFAEMQNGLESSNDAPTLLDEPDIDTPLLEAYYTAAAEFYRAAPWRRSQEKLTFRVECDQLPDEPQFLFITSPAQNSAGVAIYKQSELEAALQGFGEGDACGHDCGHDHDHGHSHDFSSDSDDEDRDIAEGDIEDCDDCDDDCDEDCDEDCGPPPDFGLMSLFGEAFEIPVQELQAIEEHGWPVACGEAYPFAFCRRDGIDEPVVPTRVELALVAACLKAAPAFLSKHSQEGEVSERFEFTFGDQPIAIKLTWNPAAGDGPGMFPE